MTLQTSSGSTRTSFRADHPAERLADPLLGGDRPGPIQLTPGSYTLHFSWRGVSDDVAVGQPPGESALDTCSIDLVPANFGAAGSSIDVTAEFHGLTCEASATASVIVIN